MFLDDNDTCTFETVSYLPELCTSGHPEFCGQNIAEGNLMKNEQNSHDLSKARNASQFPSLLSSNQKFQKFSEKTLDFLNVSKYLQTHDAHELENLEACRNMMISEQLMMDSRECTRCLFEQPFKFRKNFNKMSNLQYIKMPGEKFFIMRKYSKQTGIEDEAYQNLINGWEVVHSKFEQILILIEELENFRLEMSIEAVVRSHSLFQIIAYNQILINKNKISPNSIGPAENFQNSNKTLLLNSITNDTVSLCFEVKIKTNKSRFLFYFYIKHIHLN